MLALKEISARILKAVAKEFKNCSIDEIKSYMSECEIGTDAVDADDVPSVKLDNCEDSTINEGTRFYDVKFTVKVPGKNGGYIYLIINIEAQNDFSPGYSIIVRGVYYCARLISSQYGTVFKGSDYFIRSARSTQYGSAPIPRRNTEILSQDIILTEKR